MDKKLISNKQFLTNIKLPVSKHDSLLKEKVDSLESSGMKFIAFACQTQKQLHNPFMFPFGA
jgi:hypothetical protein